MLLDMWLCYSSAPQQLFTNIKALQMSFLYNVKFTVLLYLKKIVELCLLLIELYHVISYIWSIYQ